MKFKLKNRYIITAILFAGMTATIWSCAKRSDGDDFAAKQSATCDDGELNQGEYRIDCGGPCPQCSIDKAYVQFFVDRTWDPSDDTNYAYMRSDFVVADYSGEEILIYAVDTATSKFNINYAINFSINALWKGVHEVSNISGQSYTDATTFVGTVGLESGVIEITNKDEINGWISGKFKFNSKPEVFDPNLGPGHRVTIIQGEFVDIPLYPPAP